MRRWKCAASTSSFCSALKQDGIDGRRESAVAFSPAAAETYKAAYEARPGVSDVQIVPVTLELARRSPSAASSMTVPGSFAISFGIPAAQWTMARSAICCAGESRVEASGMA
ncbi:hypothetical protein [Streptomyces lateritius]|uniref:hypothetical protein n=1 Tax=Streptomyces lateritius TaxID=67313 RepID=UPI0016785DD2|nr:hypothetical protein [Streptomyces lateritius]GGU16978.1 hypothetical protein GCM10010272_71590 [Streptomyces lateritius]